MSAPGAPAGAARSPVGAAWRVLGFVLRHPATRGGRRRALGRVLRWQWARRRGVRRALVECAGLRFYCHPGNTTASAALYVGLPEWDELVFVLRFLRPGDRFVDVGANEGLFSLVAATRVGGAAVTAIEASPVAVAWLRENLGLNDAAVRVHACAVGAREGRARFTRGRGTTNRLARPGDDETIEVPVCTLDSLLGGEAPALVKLDVEGAEDLVFQGAARLLGGPSPPALIFEWIESVARDFGMDARAIAARLAGFGYALATYDADANALTPWSPDRRLPGASLVAARDLDAVRRRLREGAAAAPQPPIAVRVTLERGDGPRPRPADSPPA